MMPLEGKGPGMRLTIPREKLPSSDEIHEMEKVMEKEVGMPVKLVFLDPKALKIIRYIWKVNIVPKEKKSSELNKVMFDMMIKSAMGIGLQLEPEYTKERFGEVWEENPMKLFGKGPAPMPPGATPGTPPNATPGGQNKPVANVVPKKEIKIPGSPE